MLKHALTLSLLLVTPAAAAQDILTVGAATAPAGGTAQVPVFVRDTAGTPLGVDAGAGQRIQGIGFKVSYSPAAAVSSIAFTRAGVTAPLTPLYETTIASTGAIGYVVSMSETSNAIPFNSGAALPGDRIGTLMVTFSESAVEDTVVTLTVGSTTATLSNQAGTTGETVANGGLSVVSGTATVQRAATTTSVSTSGSPSLVGDNVTFTATVTSATPGSITGTVTFKDGATTLGTTALSGGTASYSTTALTAGSHSITAAYNGNVNYAPSVSSPITQVVNAPPFGAPGNVVATATSASQVSVTWTAVSGAVFYEVFRSTDNAAFGPLGIIGSPPYTDNTASGSTTYFYRVRAVDGSSTQSAFSTSDWATTVVFTNDPINAGVTAVTAAHLAELRVAVNAFRAAAGLGAYPFADDATPGTPVRALHVGQLRSALNAAWTQLGLGSVSVTDGTLTPGATVVKGVHFQELRNAVK